MNVELIAYTGFNDFRVSKVSGYIPHPDPSGPAVFPTEADELAEFAGRNCYQAWERKRPETATNAGYLKNIIDQGHFSVLEHASASFYMDGISRSLTHELVRHRHLSFSELSQRYVNMDEAMFIMPPLIREQNATDYPEAVQDEIDDDFQRHPFFEAVQLAYESTAADLEEHESAPTRKQVREAARAVLPNCVETKIVVTGNLRAWRDVLGKRWHVAADAEIREMAGLVLGHLRRIAPSSVQDIPTEPYGS